MMLAGRNPSLKPQDVVLLLKLIVLRHKNWRISDLAHALKISASEITHGLERLRLCGLISFDKKTVNSHAVLEFLVHGLKYVFPAHAGTVRLGIPTAHSFMAHSSVVSSETDYVWATEKGTLRGISIPPLYSNVPDAVGDDEKLHEALALVDALRIGKVREKKIATERLERLIVGNE